MRDSFETAIGLRRLLVRLDERIAEAVERGWAGEVEGLQTSRAAAELKLVQMQRTATSLGMPAFRPLPTSGR